MRLAYRLLFLPAEPHVYGDSKKIRISVFHTAISTLCWLHLDANTFVSLPTNSYEDLFDNVP